MASNVFGSDSSSALPGGNVAKPLIIALLALFASRYFGKKGSDQTASAEPQPAPRIPQADPADASPGAILDGLGGLVKQFQQKGLVNAVNRMGPQSAVDGGDTRGQNQDFSQSQVSDALGWDVVDQLARRTGL